MKPVNFLWDAAPGGLKPMVGEVLVFCAALDVPPKRLNALAPSLSDDERQRAGRFHRESDRQRFLAGRGLLREILGALLQMPPAAPPEQHFNQAQSNLTAVDAEVNHELGVALERIRAAIEAGQIAARCFSPGEQRCLLALSGAQRQVVFSDDWPRKEGLPQDHGAGLDDAHARSKFYWRVRSQNCRTFPTFRRLGRPAPGFTRALLELGRAD